jgi:glyoxylase-like metal-dependent hydrolase (beta-lactamase superfamily II)/rhodanese-related sulfurtransferase
VRARITSFVNEGLGHSSHFVDLGDGTALVVDPARIPTAQRDRAKDLGLRIAFTADTHTHADYVSGSPDLTVDGAIFLAPAASQLERDHQGLADGDEIDVGRYRLRAIATPGHTPDHLAYLLVDGEGPVALFSGGSLMVGAVGRTDLLGDGQRATLARSLHRALHDRILPLPDDLAVFPTHGAGSFCSAPGGGERTTTIGRERATNPLLSLPEDDFVDALLAGLGSFPGYFRQLPAVNRHGLPILADVPALAPLRVGEVERLVAAGGVVVDARPIARFAAAHIPGALSIELRPVFASWLGWLVDLERPVAFVLDDTQDEEDLVRQALIIGHDTLAGRLAGGMDAWIRSGRAVQSTELIGVEDVEGTDRALVDVRQADEYRAGHVPGASNVELGTLASTDVPNGAVTTMCGKTERAMTGASVLQRRGHPDVAVLHGGYTAWSRATRVPSV